MYRIKDMMNKIMRVPSCCLLTWTLTTMLMLFVFFDVAIGATTDATTTTEKPFIKSTMFIGLAAGIGGFIGLTLLCCVLWKCCCGERSD